MNKTLHEKESDRDKTKELVIGVDFTQQPPQAVTILVGMVS